MPPTSAHFSPAQLRALLRHVPAPTLKEMRAAPEDFRLDAAVTIVVLDASRDDRINQDDDEHDGVRARRRLEPNRDFFLEPHAHHSIPPWTREAIAQHDYLESFYSGTEEEDEDLSATFHVKSPTLRSMRHEDAPNVRLVIFHTFVLVIPTRPIAENEELTRDWFEWRRQTLTRSAILYCYFDSHKMRFKRKQEELMHVSVVREAISKKSSLAGDERDERARAFLPAAREHNVEEPRILDAGPLPKIFSDDAIVKTFLETRGALARDPSEASYWYTLRHLPVGAKQSLPDHVRGVNQFPYEGCLVRKDLLLQTIRRSNRTFEGETTGFESLEGFDLDTEFHLYYETSKASHYEKACWMIKPSQASRSHRVLVSRDPLFTLAIMGLGGSGREGKGWVAQRMVHHPYIRATRGRKFDMRTLVVVRSFGGPRDEADETTQVQAYLNLQASYARVAKKVFTDDHLDKYVNMTVTRYDEKGHDDEKNDFPTLLSGKELASALDAERGEPAWEREVVPRLMEGVRRLLATASTFVSRAGKQPQCRGAIYGLDWMVIDHDEGPLGVALLEVNFCPDLTKSVEYGGWDVLDFPMRLLALEEESESAERAAPQHGWIKL